MFQNITQRGISSTEWWGLLATFAAISELGIPAWPAVTAYAAYALARALTKATAPMPPEVAP